MNRIQSLALALLLPGALIAQQGELPRELPVKYSGPPTKPDILAGDLMTRLYIFADDSMGGRQVGTEFNFKGTAYIESEVRTLGLKPVGDSGGYFQNLPILKRTFDTTSTITIEGTTFKGGTDFLAVTGGKVHQLTGPVLFIGNVYDTTSIPSPADVRGKVLVAAPFVPTPGFNGQAFVRTRGFQAYQEMIESSTGLITVAGDQIPPGQVQQAVTQPRQLMAAEEEPVSLLVTTKVMEALLGAPIASVAKGAAGKPITTDIRFNDAPLPGRNVVAILPGSDPKLRGEFIAIGAHNDHIAFRPRPVDHDSLRVFNEVVRPQGADSPNRQPTPEEITRMRAMLDSLRKIHPARLDSINNGADDDGSGSVSLLEIAEAFAKGSAKPKRSILFIWHAGEEAGLWGSQYFTDHPTVARDSIIAELNMDMVGRGAAADVTGEDKEGKPLYGGPGYVQLVGSRRLSTELGNLVEAVNAEKKLGFKFDYAIDANGHPQNIYCRSDHAEYARYGIPVVFFTTGGHADYHQVTDEPQYIDYERMAQVSKLVFESAMKVGNLDHRVVVDHPKPDPKGACVQ
jgi:Peptidase family M28